MKKTQVLLLALALVPVARLAAQTPCPSGPPCIDGPLPQLFPADNWWNLDISAAPVDPASAAFIGFIGAGDNLHRTSAAKRSPAV